MFNILKHRRLNCCLVLAINMVEQANTPISTAYASNANQTNSAKDYLSSFKIDNMKLSGPH